MMRRRLRGCAVTSTTRHDINHLGEGQFDDRKKEACHCRNVTYGMIEDAVRSGADSPQAVIDATGAGRGCGKCRDFLEYLIRDIREELERERNTTAQ